MKTVCEVRWIDQQYRLESPEIDSHTYRQVFLTVEKGHLYPVGPEWGLIICLTISAGDSGTQPGLGTSV